MALNNCAPLTPVIGICGPRGCCSAMMSDWIREAFHTRNPVIRVEDFYKTDSELRRIARHAKGARISSPLAISLEGVKETPQALNLSALETAIKVARQTWQGDRFIIVEGALLLADEDVAGLIDVKIYLDAGKEKCSERYGGDQQFFETFVWPEHQKYNEGLVEMTHPMTANAFHVVDANQPQDATFEAVHRVLCNY
eukprot:TRINITY_DN19601_c0_g1_i1.p1 TRINITY_DN19601_c0_g1~~TRINITY_DN19601_c0_g1_i1.p1  ORF type:complete len:197 (+),score=46.31 TRINITY_DN19601_c0_g1_i1:81-671(+)